MFEPNLDKLFPGKYNSLQQYPHLTARLRGNVSPEEAFLVLRTLLRRDELDPAARVSLFSELAAHLQSVVKFPQEALEGITDERYLRNVADVIFRPRIFQTDHIPLRLDKPSELGNNNPQQRYPFPAIPSRTPNQ